MEEVFKIVAFAIISVILILVMKQQKPEIALVLTIVSAISLLLYAVTQVACVFDLLNALVEKSGINQEFLKIILKVTIIAYVIEFGKNICMDAGQSAIATKLEMAGKVVIVVLSLPIISSLVQILTGLV